MKFILLVLAIAYHNAWSQACGVPDKMPILTTDISESDTTSWPWAVKIVFDKEPWCGGSLIASNWVATAAECVNTYEDQTKQFFVRVGSLPGKQNIGVNKIFKHEGFNSSTKENDIALIQLKSPVRLSADAKTACLPNAAPQPGTKCFLLQRLQEWTNGRPVYKIFQRKWEILTNSQCISVKATQLQKKITSDMLCAENVGIPIPISGQLGAGIMCQNGVGGSWAFNGALSWQFRDRSWSVPYVVFSNAHQLRDWIEKTIASA